VNDVNPTTEQLADAGPGHRAAIAGIVFCVLYLLSFVAVRRIPRVSWSDERILAYYQGSKDGFLKFVALYVVPFAGIAFLWFLAAFRERVVRLAGSESPLLSTVQLLSGAIYVTMQFSAAATLVAAPLAFDSGLMPTDNIGAIRPFLVLGETILVVFALRAAAVFMMAGTTRALRAGLFPRWFAFTSYALAIILVLSVARVRVVTLVFPLWIGTVSVLILVRRRALLVTGEA
jgi:hypothetical protein